MKIVFLDALTMGDTPMTEIAALGEFVCYESSTAKEARQRAADCDVAIVNKIIVNDEFLDAAPKLKLVCEAGTGINNIDVVACERRGVKVRNVAGYSTDSVAQTTWMHILTLMGHTYYYRKKVFDGVYSRGSVHTDPENPFLELRGKTIGVIGMGAIGRQVAKVAEAFGMRVVYYSTSGTSHCTDYPSLSIEELLKEADVVSINAPYNNRTAGLIDYEKMKLMKPTAVLVNTGRGGIALEDDLAKAIDNEVIAGVGLDVYVKEPLPESSPLMHSRFPERVSLTPHTAWQSVEARARLAHEMAENIKRGF